MPAGAGRLRRPARPDAPAPSRATPPSRRPSGGGGATCSSTSSRTSIPCNTASSSPGLDRRPTCASWATRIRPSTAGTAPIPISSPSPAAAGRRPRSSVLDDNHRCSPEIVSVAAAVLGAAGRQLRSAGRPGPPPEYRATPPRPQKPTGSPWARAAAHDRVAWAALAVLTRTNAQLIPIQKALAGRGDSVRSPAQRALLDLPDGAPGPRRVRSHALRTLQAVAAWPRLPTVAAEPSPPPRRRRGPQRAGRPRRPGPTPTSARSRAARRPMAGLAAGRARRRLRRPGAPRRGDALQLPPGQRPRVGGGMGRRVGAGAGPDRPGHLRGGPGGRAAPPVRGPDPGRGRAARFVGPPADLRDPAGSPGASPWLELLVARADGRRPRARSRPDDVAGAAAGPAAPAVGRRAAAVVCGAPGLPDGWPEPDPDLVAALRAWRRDAARASGLPPYVILHDTTLAALASLHPATTEELLAVPGLGPVKAGRYGPTPPVPRLRPGGRRFETAGCRDHATVGPRAGDFPRATCQRP